MWQQRPIDDDRSVHRERDEHCRQVILTVPETQLAYVPERHDSRKMVVRRMRHTALPGVLREWLATLLNSAASICAGSPRSATPLTTACASSARRSMTHDQRRTARAPSAPAQLGTPPAKVSTGQASRSWSSASADGVRKARRDAPPTH
jgi:hypothetical protein